MQINYFELKNITQNYTIFCKEFLPDEVFHAMIICHGFASNIDSDSISTIASEFVSKKVACFALNFPLHGSSNATPENFTVKNCLSDVETLREYVMKKYPKVDISIFGISFGGYVALQSVLCDNKYKNVILRAPALDMKNIFVNHLLKEDFATFEKNRIARAGFDGNIKLTYNFFEELKRQDLLKEQNIQQRAIIIQGACDDVALPKTAEEFVKNNPKIALKIIRNEKHKMTTSELKEVCRYALDFMKLK